MDPFFTAPFIVKVVISIVISLIMSFISAAFTPKPKLPDFSPFRETGRDRLRQVREPVSPRELVYGEIRKSGVIVHIESTGENKFLHMVIALASHEVESIPVVFINDQPVYESQMNANGVVTSGTYKNVVRIKKHLGTTSQTADSHLVAESSVWSSNHRLREIAYVYVRLEYDQDIFPSSIPNISAWVRGKKCTEIRDSAQPSQFTTNPAIIIRDYLTTTVADMGLGFSTDEIDDSYLTSTANACDGEVTTTSIARTAGSVDTNNDCITLQITQNSDFQTGDKVNITSSGSVPGGLGNGKYIVFYQPFISKDITSPSHRFADTYEDAVLGNYIDITTAGSGTIQVVKVAEPRYTCNGLVPSDRAPHDNLGDMISSMGGRASYVGGTWKIRAAVWESATLSFDESDIIDNITVQTAHSRRERFNAVKGIFCNPAQLGVLTEYPAITNSNYEAQDNGERIWQELDLEFVTRPHTAMRLAKIALERHRQMISYKGTFKLSALTTQPGDVIQISHTTFGWTNKEFEVVEWEFVSREEEESPIFAIDLTLRETASGVFDWNNGEETSVDLAPNSNLPNPLTVGEPTGFGVTTDSFYTDNNTLIQRIVLSWNHNIDFFVKSNGRTEVQFRRTNDVETIGAPDYTWLPTSDSTLSEYYLMTNDSVPADPQFNNPYQVLENGATLTEGTAGELSASQWGYGDKDGLGFDTIYIRLSNDSDPDDSANTITFKYFEPSFFVQGNESRAYISPAKPNTGYDIRIRNINYLGVRSDWTTILNYTVGAAGAGAVSSIDYGKVTGFSVTSYDRGSIDESVDETYDYGDGGGLT